MWCNDFNSSIVRRMMGVRRNVMEVLDEVFMLVEFDAMWYVRT